MPRPSPSRRTAQFKPFLATYCIVAVVWTICLLYAGGFTTSIQAGMAFLDWPLSNGSLNPDGWLTESAMRAEHSHRLLGATVGLLTLGIALWLHLREQRRWLRGLGWAALALVVAQGFLGGARVLFDRLNTGAEDNVVAQAFAIAHACTAQVFLCTLVAIAVASTRAWIERPAFSGSVAPPVLRWSGLVTCAVVFVQLLLGATMRHNHAALAIPTFPLTPEGGLLPSAWNFGVAVHFAHRAWAVVVVVSILGFASQLWACRGPGRLRRSGPLVLSALLGLQVALGALVVWSLRNPHVATMHMLVGAFTLATCWGLTFETIRSSLLREAASPTGLSHPQPDTTSLPAASSASV